VAFLDSLTAGLNATLRWGAAVATEVVLFPLTVAALRETLGALNALPDQLTKLRDELGEARELLEDHVPPVSGVVVELGPTLEALAARLHVVADHLDPVLPKADRLLDDAPGQLTRIETTFVELSDHLDELWPKLEHLAVDDLQARVRHLDDIVEDLAQTLTAVLASIPGVRRSLTTG
jgi:uncharacterized protein YoxC